MPIKSFPGAKQVMDESCNVASPPIETIEKYLPKEELKLISTNTSVNSLLVVKTGCSKRVVLRLVCNSFVGFSSN